jgi:hypothetical protein
MQDVPPARRLKIGRPPVGPNRRPVVDGSGQLHPSVMHAAEAHGVSVTCAYNRARFNKVGWRFAETADLTAALADSPAEG